MELGPLGALVGALVVPPSGLARLAALLAALLIGLALALALHALAALLAFLPLLALLSFPAGLLAFALLLSQALVDGLHPAHQVARAIHGVGIAAVVVRLPR